MADMQYELDKLSLEEGDIIVLKCTPGRGIELLETLKHCRSKACCPIIWLQPDETLKVADEEDMNAAGWYRK